MNSQRTSAVRKGGKWVINGSKVFITNGEYANWYTVDAKTAREAGHRGIAAFVVARDAGVIVDKDEDEMGRRASNTAAIIFDECEIPGDHLLGEKPRLQAGDEGRDGPVRMYGGYGFIKEDTVEKLMREAKIMQLDEDTSQMKRLVIARATPLPRRLHQPAAAA